MSVAGSTLSSLRVLRRRLSPVGAAVALTLAACGGGSGTGTSTASTFPTGVAVGSPTDLTTYSVSSIPSGWDATRFAMKDWGSHAWAALSNGDRARLARLATAALPIASAHAAPVKMSEFTATSALIDKVLAGDASLDLATVFKPGDLLATGTNATCYGPSVQYAAHQDGGGSAGTLPTGDLGLWTEYDPTGAPCIAAQFSKRVSGVKARSMQGLLLAAGLRNLVTASSTLTMPAAGASTSLATELQVKLRAISGLSAVNVTAATISLNSTGTVYTYRVVLDNGLTGATGLTGEMILTHTPGASATQFSGVLQTAGFFLDNDAAFGCNDARDATDPSLYQRTVASTLTYSRNGSEIRFGSRDGSYCGHPAFDATSTNWAAEVAALESDGELDPTVELVGNTRGASKGWRGNFSRFAGTYDRTTVAGNFLYAWQAGTGDSNSRMLAMNTSYDSGTDTRSLKGFFAFGADIGTTNGSLLGMICNWAGPGNNHTPGSSFQSQTASLGPTDSAYTVATGGSKITYAPTNSCSSTTTQFDVNADNTLAGGEGVGTAANLDAPGGALTVQAEIESRGYSIPALF